jgi:hypothetical protein
MGAHQEAGAVKIELRPYQVEAVKAFLDRGNLLLALTQGAGKSITAAVCARTLRERGEVSVTAVFCPSSLKFQWVREIRKVDQGARIMVINGTRQQRLVQYRMARRYQYVILNYEALIHDWDVIKKFLKPDLIVADECFVAGTLVDTPSGSVPIEQVKVGDEILNVLGVGRVRRVFCRPASSLVRVRFTGGELVCTPNHAFLTARGWREARLLRYDSDDADTLVGAAEAVRLVRSRDARLPGDLGAEDREVLREVLLSEVENAPTRNHGSYAGEGVRHREEPNEDEASLRVSPTGGTEEAGADSSCWVDRRVISQAAGDLEGQRQHDQGPSRKRNWPNPGGDGSPTNAPTGVAVEPCDLAGQAERGVSLGVQGGPGIPALEAGRGGGWELSSDLLSEGARSEEDSHAGVIRVESVEILESGSSGGPGGGGSDPPFVYNLEVEGHPSYSVSGLLVHNCTAIKGMAAKRSKRLKGMSRFCPYRLALSGQPVENRPEEVFSIMEFVDATVLGDFQKFDRTFIVRDYFGRPTRYRNLHLLAGHLSTAMFRRSRADIAQWLPKLIESEVPIELDEKLMALHDAIRDDLLMVLSEALQPQGGFDVAAHYGHGPAQSAGVKGDVMTRLLALRMIASHQILLRTSAADFDREDTRTGSQYASSLVRSGALAGLPARHDKLEALFEMVEEILEEDPAHKVVVFSFFRPMLKLMAAGLKSRNFGYAMIHGDVVSEARDREIVRFNNDPSTRVFLSSDAGAYGVDLYAGSHLISYDFPWSAGRLGQRIARIDRTASTWPSINVIYLYSRATIEERMFAMLIEKLKVVGAVLDGKGFDPTKGDLPLDLESLYQFLCGLG